MPPNGHRANGLPTSKTTVNFYLLPTLFTPDAVKQPQQPTMNAMRRFLMLLIVLIALVVQTTTAFDEVSTVGQLILWLNVHLRTPPSLSQLSCSTIISHSQREEVLESRRRRKVQLEGLLADIEAQLAAHAAGEKILGDAELRSLEKKADVFTRKLDTMRDDLDDREIERIIEREKLRNQRIKEKRAEMGQEL